MANNPTKTFVVIFLIAGMILSVGIFLQGGVDSSSDINDESTVFPSKKSVSLILSEAPEAVLSEIFEEKTIKISQFKNEKAVLLVFWTTWCEKCESSFPELNNFAEDYKAVEVIGINIGETDEQVKAFLDQNGRFFQHAIDNGTVASLYGVEKPGTYIFIDQQGIVQQVTKGGANTAAIIPLLTE